MRKIIFCTLSLLVSVISIHADILSDKMESLGFTEATPPKPGTKEWSKANHSRAYIVELDEDLKVRLPEKGEVYNPEVSFDAGTVKYIGIDHGEFGGGLYLDSYSKDKKPFFHGNIRALIPIKNDLYIIEGLAHMIFNGGSVHVIRDYKKPSKPERITLLPSAPEVVFLDEVYANNQTGIIIIGHDSFMILIPKPY